MNRSSAAGILIRPVGQSLVEDDGVDEVDVEADDDPASPPDGLSADGVVELFSAPSSDAFLPAADAERRSFFAQPLPLNTIVGGAKALRIGPEPHSGQASGAGSCTPWMTSKRRPHAAQM